MRCTAVILDNPIFIRELRRRMRGRGVIFTLIAYVLLMCAISFVVILAYSLGSSSPPQKIGEQIGRNIFTCVAFVQAFLVWLAAPSIAAGVTNAERERQTFEFLQVTTLSARAYVVGNLLSTAMYVLLVLVCALPVMSVSFLYGGIGIDDVLTTFGVLLTLSMALSCFALFASSAYSKARGVQTVVTIVCAVMGLFMITRGLIFVSFAAAGGTPYFRQPVSLLGWNAPRWVPWVLLCALLCFALLVGAGRKLYTPDNRLFNYRQFLGFFLILQFLFVVGDWGRFGAAKASGNWMALSALTLYLGAMLFSTGRPAPGDEVWNNKRRHPSLRRIDEAFLYILGLSALWVAFGAVWTLSTAKFKAAGWTGLLTFPEIQAALQALAYFITSALLIFLLGRLVSQFTYSHRSAFWWLVALCLVVFVLLPMLADALGYAETGYRAPDHYLSDFSGLSPLGVVLRTADVDLAHWADSALSAMAILFTAGAVAVAVAWALARRRNPKVVYDF